MEIIVAIIAGTATITAALIGLIGIFISRRSKGDEEKVKIGFEGRRELQDPSEITAEKRNRLKIESDFLHWPQCTILLWVFVPPKGQGLRNSPTNRYIIAHQTGEVSDQRDRFYNQFVLRHSSTRERWEVQISNGKAEYPDSSLGIGDGLEMGWHHFMIAWDNEKPKLEFAIDRGKGGTELWTSYRSFWPDASGEKVTVEAWTSDYWAGHFCETKLYQLWILDSFLELTDLGGVKE